MAKSTMFKIGVTAFVIVASGFFQNAAVSATTTMKRMNQTGKLTEFIQGSFPSTPVVKTKMSAGAKSAEEKGYDVLLEEDFSLMTKGTAESPDEISYPVDFFETNNSELPDDFFKTPGWFGCGVHEAGGMVCLDLNQQYIATEDDIWQGLAEEVGEIVTIHDGGVLMTPYMKMPGRVRVSFKVKALDANMTFTYYMYPSTGDLGTCKLSPDEGWKDIEFLTDIESTKEYLFGINARFRNKGRLLIDDLRIEREIGYVTPVQNIEITDYKYDGFTASWEEVQYASDYLVSLISETASGETELNRLVSFENDEEEGISYEGIIMKSEESPACDGENELLLRNNGDYFEIDGNGGLISEFVFYMQSRDTDWGFEGTLLCDVYDGQQWIEGYTFNYLSWLKDGWNIFDSTARDVTLAPYGLGYGNRFTKIRFRIDDVEEGALAIDKVIYKVKDPVIADVVYEDYPVEDTRMVFENLDHDSNEYYLIVKARSVNGMVSETKNRLHAFGLPSPNALEATDINPRGAFTANWESSPKAESYKLQLFSVNTITEDTDNCIVFSEGFSKARNTSPTATATYLGNGTEIISLDDYCDNPGWTGSGTIIGDNLVGCLDGNSQTNQYYEIYSPEIDLEKNGGVYSVTVRGVATKDDYLTIQGGVEDYHAIRIYAEMPFEATVELTGGERDTRLMIYTVYNSMFALSHIDVSQNLKSGDRIYKLIRYDNIDGTEESFRVNNLDLDESMQFAYSLQSAYTFRGKRAKSEWSNRVDVNLNQTGIDTTVSDSEDIVVKINGDTVSAILEEDALIEIFSITGNRIASVNGKSGVNEIQVVIPGVYVLATGDKRIKFIIQ